MATYAFDKVLVWDVNPGGVVRTLRNATVTVRDGATNAVLQTVTADANGRVQFSTTDVPTVVIESALGFTQRVTSQDAVEAAAGFTVSEDAAVAALVGDGGSGTRAALDPLLSPKADKSGTPKSLADFGVLPTNTAAQNRAGFTAAAASGFRDLVLPAGTYQWSAASEGQWMMSWTGAQRIRVRGLNAVINDTTTRTNDGALGGLFLLDGCKDFEVSGIEYVGPTLATPNTLLGYQGATIVRAINATDGVRVDMRATNARYGVQTGDYADPSKGGCRNFTLRLSGSMVGYPFAGYLADKIELDIDVDGVHRAAYIAGCNGVSGTIRYRDQYIAPIAVLITDVLTSGTDAAAQANPTTAPTTSRGCTGIDLRVYEKGSTTYVADSYAVGISLSRVDPGTAFRDIRARVYLTATNTISTTIHGFQIGSTANTIWSRYPFNWEPSILLENISFGGVIDKSATTVATTAGGSNGPVTLRTDDPAGVTHAATIRNLRFDDLLIRRGAVTSIARLYVRGLATPMVVDRLAGPDAAGASALYVLVAGNSAQPVIFNQSSFATLDMSVVPDALVTLGKGTAVTAPDADRTVTTDGGTLRGAGPRRRTKYVTVTGLSGASVTVAGAIPAGSRVEAIQGRVTTAITGASGFQLGVTGDLTKYADRSVTGTGNLVQPEHHAATAWTAPTYAAAADLIVTAKTSNFTGGVLRLVIHYWEYPALAN